MIYYNNLSAFTEVHYGNTNIDEVYFGNNKVWPEGTPPFGGKFKATYSNGTEYEKNCDGNAMLSTSDTKPSGYQFTTMTEATIGDCVTTISERAFSVFQNLTSVTIGNSVQTIGNNAFFYCTALTNATIPDSVTSIGSYAFSNCGSLTSCTIGSGVTSIGNEAFRNCTSLTSCTIGSGVTSIGTYTFGGCSSLTSIDIPNSVTSIGSGAFQNCSGLTSITINATTPPTLGDNGVFSYTNNCPIYVPAESVDAYKTATRWSTFASRIQAIP